MQAARVAGVSVEHASIESGFLERKVKIDFYLPLLPEDLFPEQLLLINDGQDMEQLGFEPMLNELYTQGLLQPLLCIGIHAGPDRKMEYGIAGYPDYKGRGAKATAYTSFIFEELLPFIEKKYSLSQGMKKAFAGFSLGGLSAMDITWRHPETFTRVGVFSGSFWWRSIDQGHKNYDDHKHRIMHQLVREGRYVPGLSFYFQCGNMDETRDRNQNGIIDSIDDTLDLIEELVTKGYDPRTEIVYNELPDGRHDVPTWARAMPSFLTWGWPGTVPGRT